MIHQAWFMLIAMVVLKIYQTIILKDGLAETKTIKQFFNFGENDVPSLI